jgi:CubicO group peptidase (beta-lactamase class C family)
VSAEVGWSLAVGHRGEVVHTECTGPHSPATRFDIGSTSKQFTALAAILTLDLDDEDWRLIHHQTGLPDYIELLEEQGVPHHRRTTTDDALDVLKGRKLAWDAGTRFVSSNTNSLLLGIRLARTLGKPVPDILRDRIFEPLGLDLVMDPLGRVPDRATSVDEDGRPADSIWEQVGDGAVWGNPSELARWGDAWSSAPFGADVLREQLTTVEGEGGDRYGAGIFVTPDGRLHHDGSWSGFRTRFAVDPAARVTVAVCANQPGLLADDHGLPLLDEWVGRLGH